MDINEMWYMHTVEYYSACKGEKILLHAVCIHLKTYAKGSKPVTKGRILPDSVREEPRTVQLRERQKVAAGYQGRKDAGGCEELSVSFGCPRRRESRARSRSLTGLHAVALCA